MWKQWCKFEDFPCSDAGVIFTLKDNARVYEIDKYDDLENLISECGIDAEYDGGWGFLTCPDFEKIAEKYDAIHLTDAGEHYTRFSRPYSLYGWDVESYLILNFEAIENWRKYNAG